MKRALLLLALLTLAAPASAQGVSDTGGPIVSQAQRDVIAERVRGGASCPRCDLFQIDLSYQDVEARDFSGARMRQSDLSLISADGSRFRGANLSLVNAFGGRFAHADFTNANLNHTQLIGGYFGYGRFAGATLNGANISGSDFTGVTGLTQAQLNAACGDAQTILPAGLSVPACGA